MDVGEKMIENVDGTMYKNDQVKYVSEAECEYAANSGLF